MPPQLQALLENKNLLIGVIAGVVLIVVLSIVMAVSSGGGAEPKKEDPGAKPLLETQRSLAVDISAGKAIEMQAVLARQGIRLETEPGTGGKVSLLFGKEATLHERDEAILAMVSSGLMDGHLGMEAFDSSDMMASREEKQVKLMRAQQGELARIVRKIKPIEDANVKITLPDPTLFAAEKQPPSASVQVTLPPAERLTRDKVRAIINLMVGAVQGLQAKNVALTDTNGNTYNSVITSSAEIQDKMEEEDSYMKQKVMAQLDRLIGAGNYVATVATQLREAPREMMVQQFDPARSAVSSKQRFSENLGGGSSVSSSGLSKSGGPTSNFLPPELDSKVAFEKTSGGSSTLSSSGGGDGYTRDGIEVSYDNARTQWVESAAPGMIEAVTIAITIDDKHYPNLPPEDLQTLIARAASPRVNPSDVSIVRTAFQAPLPLTPSSPMSSPPPNEAEFLMPGLSEGQSSALVTWLPWMGVGMVALIALFVVIGIQLKANQIGAESQHQQGEVEALRASSQQQQEALAQQQQLAQQLLQQQQQLVQQMQQVQQSPQGQQRLQESLQRLQQQPASPVSPAAMGNTLGGWLNDG